MSGAAPGLFIVYNFQIHLSRRFHCSHVIETKIPRILRTLLTVLWIRGQEFKLVEFWFEFKEAFGIQRVQTGRIQSTVVLCPCSYQSAALSKSQLFSFKMFYINNPGNLKNVFNHWDLPVDIVQMKSWRYERPPDKYFLN